MSNSNRPIFSEQDRSSIRVAAKRPLIYLDSCVWIDVAERFDDLSQQCRLLVQTGKALFPLSFASVTEVMEQPTAEKRSRVASLMDELSEGLCFRNSDTIHELEANLALPVVLSAPTIAIQREDILTWIVEFAAKMTVKFPPSWTQADQEKFMHLLATRPELRSVKWLADHSAPGQMRLENAERMERYVQNMATVVARSVALHRHLAKDVRGKQLLLEERTAVVKNLVAPQLSKNILNISGPEKLLGSIAEIAKKVGAGSRSRLDLIMTAMPSLDLYCHIMAERGRNNSRKPRAQDFFDVEHAVVGAVYADFFITSDGNLFDLLTKRCKISAQRGCRVLRGVSGLEEALKEIAN